VAPQRCGQDHHTRRYIGPKLTLSGHVIALQNDRKVDISADGKQITLRINSWRDALMLLRRNHFLLRYFDELISKAEIRLIANVAGWSFKIGSDRNMLLKLLY
jgi:hypothetical protein